MKVLLLISISMTLLASIAVSAQNVSFKRPTTCTNRSVEQISSRETIKIGAKIEDVLNLFASTEEEKQRLRNSASGRKRTNLGFDFFSAGPKPGDARFEGISYYAFSFLDGRLVSYTVNYTKPKWKNARQFAEKMSEIFGLPEVEYWSNHQISQATLQCENYQVQIQTHSGTESYLGIYDNRIDEILKQREQKLEDEQREKDLKAFKP